jgi:hypothetical protein
VNMRVMAQLLSPAVKHAEEADLSSQKFGITGDLHQRFSAEPKQHGVDELFVLQCKLRQKTRHCEHNMGIRNGKKFFLPSIDPTTAGVGLAFGTMPVSTCNGELTISCLMVSVPLWRGRDSREEVYLHFSVFWIMSAPHNV